MEKIPGAYVNIRQSDGKFFLDYIDAEGVLTWINILYHSEPRMVEFNKRDLEKHLGEIESVTDPKKAREMRSYINWLRLAIKLPEIYASHCAGLSISPFFEGGTAMGGQPTKASEYAPNRRYQKVHFEFFLKKWDELRSQERAFDELAKAYEEIDNTKLQSFLTQFREWRKEQKKT